MVSFLDVILLAFAGYGIFVGFRKGFVIQLISLIGVMFGSYVAFKFSMAVRNMLHTNYEQYEINASFITFLVLFFLFLYLINRFEDFVGDKMVVMQLNRTVTSLGMVTGAFRMIYIASIFLILFGLFHLRFDVIPREWVERSWFYRPVSDMAPSMIRQLDFTAIREKLYKSGVKRSDWETNKDTIRLADALNRLANRPENIEWEYSTDEENDRIAHVRAEIVREEGDETHSGIFEFNMNSWTRKLKFRAARIDGKNCNEAEAFEYALRGRFSKNDPNADSTKTNKNKQFRSSDSKLKTKQQTRNYPDYHGNK